MPPEPRTRSKHFEAKFYNLRATLDCGQAFRWLEHNDTWTGVIHGQWIQISNRQSGILVETTASSPKWDLIAGYFRFTEDIESITKAFPDDEHMTRAVSAYRGLRLLRQDPWECLASFILSSTKQIRHIRQIISKIAKHHGEEIPSLPGHDPAFTFPGPETLAQLSENALRELGMGYRAPYLRQTAQTIAAGKISLSEIGKLPYPKAKALLQQFAGVGPKIADCVLLFAYGKQQAFPIDVWVKRAINELYFAGQKPNKGTLENFAQTYFQPNSGYAQQYLFHYIRMMHTKGPQSNSPSSNL